MKSKWNCRLISNEIEFKIKNRVEAQTEITKQYDKNDDKKNNRTKYTIY